MEEIEAARRRVAVVTGAASGIGRALAQEAGRRGMSVALADIDLEGLVQTESLLRAAGVETVSSVVDVRRRADLMAFADLVRTGLGRPQLIFANAGVLRSGPLWTLAESDSDLMIDVNLKGALNTASVFLPQLIEQSSACGLIFTASVGALTAAPNLAVYSATKHALWAIAESTLRDLRAAGSQVEVSLLCPGAVVTALADHAAGGPAEQSLRERMAEAGLAPAEVARCAFEAIDAGRFWIFPQESYLPAIARRLERVLTLSPPTGPSRAR